MRAIGLWAACLLVGGLGVGQGQSPNKAPQDPTVLQKAAYERYADVKASMKRLHEMLARSDPEKARKLQAGLVLLQEKRIDDAMQEIEALLAGESWERALERMEKVQKDLALLLGLLMDRDLDLQEILEEIARLEGFKQRVEALLAEQRGEKARSAEAEALEARLRALERAKRDAERLIEEQRRLREKTEARGTGTKSSQDLARSQGELREDTEALEQDLKRIEREAGEASGQGQGAAQGSGAAGSGAAGKAAEAMQRAQGRLSKDEPEPALDDQDEAIDELERAQQAIEKLAEETRRRLLEIPFDELRRQQLETMQKTENLADEMKESSEGGAEGGQGSSKPTPGQDNVQQAVPEQKSAAGALKEVRPGKAKQEQQDAEDQLEQAQKKLEDAINQLRQELLEEALRALEERFTAMLSRQREVSADTRLTHKWRERIEALVKEGVTPTAVKERCQKLAEAEADLRQEALDALELIEAEGSSAVFPEVVKGLADDLALAAATLDRFDTGEDLQQIQKEIEKTLERLIDALTRRIEMLESGGT